MSEGQPSPLKTKRTKLHSHRSNRIPLKSTTTTSSTSSSSSSPHRKGEVERQTCPSYHHGHLPTMENVQRLRTLTAPHVESFNYFLEHGLTAGIQSLEPAEFDLLNPTSTVATQEQQLQEDETDMLQDVSTVQFWVEDVTVAKPMKSVSSGARSTQHNNNSSNNNSHNNSSSSCLYPREARERGCMYSGTISATFCYRIIERRNYTIIPNKIIRIPNKNFGDMPIMVLSKSCHLHNRCTPQQLTQLKEEVGIKYLLVQRK
jgi:DNA-directed RNA polymerase beta subunit